MGYGFTGVESSILIFVCWLGYCLLLSVAASPMVQVKNGTLEGTVLKSRKGRDIVSFRGVPYAQPPIGKLRFEPPKQSNSWTGVRSAKEDASICPQMDIFTNPKKPAGDEDCLYLNVYSPRLPDGNDSTKTNYPVMIWLHGGSFYSGSAHSTLFEPKFLLDHDVVLVTVNYRLGSLGFLSTEDDVCPGNQGLKDQAQSIRWVHENIAAFSGDTNRVTLFGTSAGGISVHFHMISPLSKGLFHRAISQSGTVFCPAALSRFGQPRNHTNRLGELLNCPTGESARLIDCLREKDAEDFVNAAEAFNIFGSCPEIPFKPVIEGDRPGAFLKEEPADLLKSGNVNDVPWIIGTNSHEGALKASWIYGTKDEENDKLLDEKFMEIVPFSLLYENTCPEQLKDFVTTRIHEFYFGDKKIDKSTRMNVVDMYTDGWFFITIDNAVKEHFEGVSSPVYYYHFQYKGTSSLSNLADADNDYGVAHGDETQYLFPMEDSVFNGTKMSKEDYKMVDLMTKLWVNFAESGNPTPELTPEIPLKWKAIRSSNLEYFHIVGPDNLSMQANLHSERVNFWKSIPYRGKIKLKGDSSRNKDEF